MLSKTALLHAQLLGKNVRTIHQTVDWETAHQMPAYREC